ncbi:cyclin-dependent kinase 2-associated protein 1 [Caerostris darwini]|uniref:Cyclin-dependent kinase 2-associated protein 1 n=2 Tax=Caerostris TaxID=172845 RepID=A0AAV4U1Z8_9ARAC|nr:cyclin-dependent kinase 2-associated protein 1 [Caerostris darwini]GIY96966.1 cyclin-dependent kinase 2-associated protein 1 [Caerostris extrusa]
MNKSKMEEDNHSIDSPAQSNPGTPLPSNPGTPRNDKNDDIALVTSTSCYPAAQSSAGSSRQQPKPKYSQLLAIIEELGKDIRPTYAGSRSSAERLKRGIVHARILVRECLMETERNARS